VKVATHFVLMIKVVPNAFADGIEGVGVHPLVLTIKI
jgi:hypothetical protein